jgi:hypothetical protein
MIIPLTRDEDDVFWNHWGCFSIQAASAHCGCAWPLSDSGIQNWPARLVLKIYPQQICSRKVVWHPLSIGDEVMGHFWT